MNVEQRAMELMAGYGGSANLADYGYDSDSEIYFEDAVLDMLMIALTSPEGYVRAVDRELVTAEIGVANPDDSFEVASQKLHELIMWHVKVATDPAVNGGFVLVPVDSVKKCACGCYRYCCVHCGTELGGVDSDRPEAP